MYATVLFVFSMCLLLVDLIAISTWCSCLNLNLNLNLNLLYYIHLGLADEANGQLHALLTCIRFISAIYRIEMPNLGLRTIYRSEI